MNFGQLRTHAFDYLVSSPAQGPWTDAQMGRYINIAQYKVHGMVADEFEDFFSTTSTLSETSGTDTISLPTDLYRILSVERISGNNATVNSPIPLEKIDRRVSEIRAWRGAYPYTNGTAAFPCAYYAIGQKQIRLIPMPASTNTNSLRLTYIFRPAEMGSDIDVPFQQTAGSGGAGTDSLVEFHDVIAMYAVEMCLLTPGEENPALAESISARRSERENELKTYLARINLQANKRQEVTDAVTDYD